MKWLNRIIIFFVGSLFIFSGLVKINDPIGTAIKLEEYFEVFEKDLVSGFHHLIPFSLVLSVTLCAAEIVLGAALLANFKRRLTVDLLLLLIVFFTFLTFYSAYFEKVTECGCFGTVFVLTPWQSFTKDIVLLVLILVLFVQRRHLDNVMMPPATIAVALSTVASLGIAFYSLWHLPPVDTLPYKVGNSIPAQMKPAEPCVYEYVMSKNGEQHRFKDYPTDTTYKFVEMITLNEKNCRPIITDYNLRNEEGDFTEESFKGNKLLVVVQKVDIESVDTIKSEGNGKVLKYNFDDGFESRFKDIVNLVNNLKGIDVMVLTSAEKAHFEALRHEVQLAAPYYLADGVVLKTMIRSSPGLLLLREGTVKGKWHYNDVPAPEEVTEKLAQ